MRWQRRGGSRDGDVEGVGVTWGVYRILNRFIPVYMLVALITLRGEPGVFR